MHGRARRAFVGLARHLRARDGVTRLAEIISRHNTITTSSLLPNIICCQTLSYTVVSSEGMDKAARAESNSRTLLSALC